MSISAVTQKAVPLPSSQQLAPKSSPFSNVLEGMKRSGGILKTDLHRELEGLRVSMLQGKKFTAQEILYYQIRFSDFHMRIEMLSKVAEGATATVRRFEQAGS